MKPHSSGKTPAFLALLLLVGMTACVSPGPGGPRYATVGTGYGYYDTLPRGYAGDAYLIGGRYYYGGRYESGTYYDQGRRYSDRYYHDGRYYYGGNYQRYPSSTVSGRSYIGGASPTVAGYYTTIPANYSGTAYLYGDRYYYGGRYETGNFDYQGRRYSDRYYHNDRYYYGGRHEQFPSRQTGLRERTGTTPTRVFYSR
jgi:hypothetical protein